jgi:hypothetical protein
LILERSEGIICAGLDLNDALLATKMQADGEKKGDETRDALGLCDGGKMMGV